MGILFAALASVMAGAADFSIQWRTNSVEVPGLPQSVGVESAKALSVYADQGNVISDMNLPAMAGRYSYTNGVLTFTPLFPFQAEVNYRAVLRVDGKITSSTKRILAAPLETNTVVTAIYPAGDKLPENVLKFYLLFSAPMSGGHIYDHIHLRNSDGKEVQLPFLEIDEELWDPTMTRLTLFLDPGRIKRGVRPLEEIGPALQSGKTYTLRIGRDWRDAKGAPLKADFAKIFSITDADRESPNPLRWKITPPKAKTRNAVTVVFDEPLDHAIAQRVLRVTNPTGAPVEGVVKLDPIDSTWTLVPNAPWKAGVHKLVVPTIIEDLAGNNIGKPFDVDLDEPRTATTNEVVRVSFTVR